jgi:hypothetical protein
MKPFVVTAAAAAAALFGLQAVAQMTSPGQLEQRAPGQSQQSTSRGATPSQSADPSGGFEQLDANKDGTVDKKEAARQPGLSGAFEKADINRDGKLDRTEYDAASKMTK